jgi:AraC-like DNA-binding protein
MNNIIAIGSISGRKNNSEHKHNEWEMLYFTEGTGIITVDAKEYPFQAGDCILIPPGVLHSTRSDSGYGDIFVTINVFNNPLPDAPFFADNEGKVIYNLLKYIYLEFHMKRDNWQNITDALLAVVYEYIVSWGYNKTTYSFVDHIENELISNLSNISFAIDEIMLNIPLSKDYAYKVFKRKTGKTPLNYLTEKRINFAKQLLLSRKSNFMTIKEIANAVGFQDQYYFSRVFKRATGKSPTEWSLSE